MMIVRSALYKGDTMTILAKVFTLLMAINGLALLASIVFPVLMAATVITPALLVGVVGAVCGAAVILAYVVCFVFLS